MKQGHVIDHGSNFYVHRPKVQRGKNLPGWRERLGLPFDPEEDPIEEEKNTENHDEINKVEDEQKDNRKNDGNRED